LDAGVGEKVYQHGRIDRAEFGHLMDALGADAPEDELDMGFDLIDATTTARSTSTSSSRGG
jgi:Ca2+-binding EF-hand superfamily protein